MRFNGIPGVPGIGVGEIIKYELLDVTDHIIRGGHNRSYNHDGSYINSWSDLVELGSKELAALIENMQEVQGSESEKSARDILNVQLEILNDPLLADNIIETVNKGVSLKESVKNGFAVWKKQISSLQDEYIKNRVQDLDDLEKRLLNILSGKSPSFLGLRTHVILVANELLPSELLQLDRNFLKGLVLAYGSLTSHTVLLAKAFGIPTILGAYPFIPHLENGKIIKINGENGEITDEMAGQDVVTGQNVFASWDEIHNQHKTNRQNKNKYCPRGVETADDFKIKLLANLDTLEEAGDVKRVGAQGIGLFRTEFLYLKYGKNFSQLEEEEAYAYLLQEFGASKVIIRLLDLGSDKPWADMSIPKETNPALGERGIRLLLKHPSILKRQIRTIFKAVIRVFNDSKKLITPPSLLIPMVTSFSQIEEVKNTISNIMQDFPLIKFPCIGAMIEVPAMALSLPVIAKEVDFISIGTNDLVQYGMAIDRLNPEMQTAWQEPGILRLLAMIIKEAKRLRIPLSVCGEIAGLKEGIVLLLGLGVRSFSMIPGSIPVMREYISKIEIRKVVPLVNEILKFPNKFSKKELVDVFCRMKD